MTAQPTRDQLRALADRATEGPWYAERRREDYYDLTTVYNVFHNGDTMDRDLVAEVAYDNADFIAAARTALPALLDALDQAEARIKAVEDVLDTYEEENANTPHTYPTPHGGGLGPTLVDAGDIRRALDGEA